MLAMDMPTPHEVLLALHHPVRRRLNEVLLLHGPATVGQLAERLDLAVGSVSHHLKVLAAADLVQPAPELAADGRQSWWRADPAPMSWSVADYSAPIERATAESAELENAAYEARRVRTWYEQREQYSDEWAQASFATNGWVIATADELDELGRRINDLIVEWAARRKPGTGDAAETGAEPAFVFARGFRAEP